jgi:hypothetical protein
MPQNLFSATAFAHRHNLDGTWDSICTRCFLTIATEWAEDGLSMHEQRHDCDSLMRARNRVGYSEKFGRSGPLLQGRPPAAWLNVEDESNWP